MEKLIKAFQIFLKYGNPEYPTSCEHDIMFVFIDPGIVSDEDKKTLCELGFIYHDGEESFSSFKYGSA